MVFKYINAVQPQAKRSEMGGGRFASFASAGFDELTSRALKKNAERAKVIKPRAFSADEIARLFGNI